jgi:biopolymer transport protein ExbD
MRVSRRASDLPSPNMTPMIDCVFQLLIFFITTASLAQMSLVHLFLPTEKGNPAASAGSMGLVVNLTANGGIVVNDRGVALSELTALAKEALVREPSAVPVIRADREARADDLNKVMKALRGGGCRSIRVATVKEGDGG